MRLLAALAFQALAATAAAVPCAFNTPKQEIARDSSECALLSGLGEDFNRLARAADFKEDEIRLRREIHPALDFNAVYSESHRAVTLSRGFVSCALAHPGVATTVLAHEIGHAVQDREGLVAQRREAFHDPSLSLDQKRAFSRRFEAQADRIGQDLLARAGFSQDVSRVVSEMYRECVGSSGYFSEDVAAPAQSRVIEALRAADRRQAEVAMSLAGLIHDFDQKASQDLDGPSAPRSAPERYQPQVSMEELNAQGRTTKGLLSNGDLPLSRREQQLKLDSKTVLVAPGVVWAPDPRLLALYSPDELIVLATRASLPAGIDFRGAVSTGLSRIIHYRLWNLLPGRVIQFDSNDPARSGLFSRQSREEAQARQAAAYR